ncbi:MAG: zinc ribbon-containing (seleno)protein DG [Desulfurivibrionaceae bacterium]
MIERDLKYCPKCRDEYRAEAETCAACAIALVWGAELVVMESNNGASRRNRKGPLTPDDQLVVVFQGALGDLKHLKDLLEAEQIGAMISKEGGGCASGGCAPKFELQVRQEEVRDALEVLAEEHRRATALAEHDATHAGAVFNPEAGEAVCPACGFGFATTTTTCPDCGLCFG